MLVGLLKKRALRRASFALTSSLLTTTALAGDLIVTGAQTTPVVTSNANGGGPGNVTVQSGGSITVTTGAAVTVDSSNTMSNSGTVQSNAEQNAVGVQVSTTNASGQARDITGAVTNAGTITLSGPSSSSTVATSSVYNTGILISGLGTFHGNVTQSAGSVLTVGGYTSTGILASAALDGTISNSGRITVSGSNSFGIQTTGTLSGNLINAGTVEATGLSGIGIYSGGSVGGSIINQGSITTGSLSTTSSSGSTTAAVNGGVGLWVANNANGILLEGNGVTKALESSTTIPAGTPADSSITTNGGADALVISAGGAGGIHNLTVGTLAGDSSNSSLLIRGNVTSTGVANGASARAISIIGSSLNGIDYTTTFTGALRNLGGDISATTIDGQATAIQIGKLTRIPLFTNTGDILARAVDSSENADGTYGSGGGNAYGLVIDAGGQLLSVTNSGNITAESHGGSQSAYGIIDNSGTLTNVVNTGSIIATVKGSGAAVGLDLSHATQAVTITNSNVITGTISTGAGDDTLISTGGALTGAISMGDGNDRISLANTTTLGAIDLGAGSNVVTIANSNITGGITTTGTASVQMTGTALTIPAGSQVAVNSLSITSSSSIHFYVNASGTVNGIAAGSVTLGNDTALSVSVLGTVHDKLAIDLIEAQSLIMNRDLSSFQPSSSVMYTRQLAFSSTDPNTLQLVVTRRNAGQLHLSANLGAVYEGIIDALDTDEELTNKLGGFTQQSDLEHALNAMLPDTGAGTRLALLGADNASQSLIRRRLDGQPRNRDEPFGRYRSSYWAQTFGTYGSQAAVNEFPGFHVTTLGIAGGMDAELDNGIMGGFSVSQVRSSVDEGQSANRDININTTALDFYGRANLEPIYVQGMLGAAYDGFHGKRKIQIDTISRTSAADWSGNHVHASLDVGSVLELGEYTQFSIYGRGAYARLYQQGYNESGGTALDLSYVSRTTTSVRGGGGMIASYVPEDTIETWVGDLRMGLTIHGDYAHEFNIDPQTVRARFAASTSYFTVQAPALADYTVSGGAGFSLGRRFSTLSLDYDAESTGKYLSHAMTLTFRQRF